jgi:hypothetical protein
MPMAVIFKLFKTVISNHLLDIVDSDNLLRKQKMMYQK